MGAPTGRIFDRLRAWALACLPHHASSRLIFRLTRLRTRLKRPLVHWFIRRYGVDMSEAAEPDPDIHESFNAFFTRALRDGARPLEGGDDTLVSPVDGRISQFGPIRGTRLFQAKGIEYELDALLGGEHAAEPLRNGSFATLYLAPGDYHRIHMPMSGTLRAMTHVPGRLFSVAPWTVATVPGLFTRNERVCAFFDGDHGPFALVLVGAINVAAIETVWAGLVTPPTGHDISRIDYADGPRLERGAEAGRFNMGSTVIVITASTLRWASHVAPSARTRMGRALAQFG